MAHSALDTGQHVTPIRLPFGLYRFLERVQMDEERIGLQIVDSVFRKVDAAGHRQLDTAKIADQGHRRRALTHGSLRSSDLETGPLRADSQRNTCRLGNAGKRQIDFIRTRGAACH
jgi:hypothetical protein